MGRLTHTANACLFLQAEDGIRDTSVTGVQTCALPISIGFVRSKKGAASDAQFCTNPPNRAQLCRPGRPGTEGTPAGGLPHMTVPELAGLAGVGACASAFLAWAVRGRASSVFGPSVHHGPSGRKAIALTFDDGPSESTPCVLELLDKYQTPATFFQIGANVERLPEIARAVHAAGHEIGNHSHM